MSDKMIEVQSYYLDSNKELITVEFAQTVAGISIERVVYLHIDEVDHYLEITPGVTGYSEGQKLRALWQYDDNPTFRSLKEDAHGILETYLEWHLNINYIKGIQAECDHLLERTHEKLHVAIRDVGACKAMLEIMLSNWEDMCKRNGIVPESVDLAKQFCDKIEAKYNSNTLKQIS